MAKNNIRSIRFSDELAELIDHQEGDTLTQKFENLITKCVWELPEKERQLKQIEQRIQQKRTELAKMDKQARSLSATINDLFPKVRILETAIDQQINSWDK